MTWALVGQVVAMAWCAGIPVVLAVGFVAAEVVGRKRVRVETRIGRIEGAPDPRTIN